MALALVDTKHDRMWADLDRAFSHIAERPAGKLDGFVPPAFAKAFTINPCLTSSSSSAGP